MWYEILTMRRLVALPGGRRLRVQKAVEWGRGSGGAQRSFDSNPSITLLSSLFLWACLSHCVLQTVFRGHGYVYAALDNEVAARVVC